MNNHSEVKFDHWMRLILPTVLGLIAGVCYWTSVSSKLTPVYFVQVNREIQQGEEITLADLSMVSLTGDTDSLANGGALTDAGLARGAKAKLRLVPGQMLLQDHLMLKDPPGDRRKGERTLPLSSLEDVHIASEIQVNSFIEAIIRTPDESGPGATRRGGKTVTVGPFRVIRIIHDDEGSITQLEIATKDYPGRVDPEYVKLVEAVRNERLESIAMDRTTTD